MVLPFSLLGDDLRQLRLRCQLCGEGTDEERLRRRRLVGLGMLSNGLV